MILIHYRCTNCSAQTFGEGIDHPLAKRAEDDLESAAISFVQSHLSVNPDTISFKSGFANDVAHHAFVRQQIVRPFSSCPVRNKLIISFRTVFRSPTPLQMLLSTRTTKLCLSAHLSSNPVGLLIFPRNA